MKVKVITLFPELINSYLQDALIAKAIKSRLFSVETINLRDFSDNNYKSVDDAPFGGGDGMLIRPEILEKALQQALIGFEKAKVIYLSPQGELLNHESVQQIAFATDKNLILICGRYAGIDQRFIDQYVDAEISVGNYVLSGGELAALVLIESVSRHIPGVLGNAESPATDSLYNNLLEAPQYTRPQVWNDRKVPDVLLSGNHQKIAEWKKQMSLQVTQEKRPDLLTQKLKENK